MLSQLCGSLDRLAASSTQATQATATLAEHSCASAVAAAAAAATHAQLQQTGTASAATLPGPLSRAAAECVVRNTGFVASLVLKGVGKMAAEADVVAAILCHKVLLTDYVPPKAAAGGDGGQGPLASGRAHYLTLRCAVGTSHSSFPDSCLVVVEGCCAMSMRAAHQQSVHCIPCTMLP